MRSFAAFGAVGLLAVAAPALADEPSVPVHKVTQSESYVMVDPIYSTVFDAGKPAGTLMVAIGLNIPDAKLRSIAERAMPLLCDDYLRSLMNFTSSAVRPSQQPDVSEIAARLQRVTDRALRKKGARVLLAEVAMHITR
jgi:hypothetical protein